MLTPKESEKRLKQYFGKYRVGQLEDLFQVLQTHSRMSVFRRLKTLGYLSSFTHAGRYYTLANLPEFDRWGLWFHRQVGFSKVGTLKATIVELVQSASDGMTPKEMRGLLRLPVSNTLYNTLHELVHSAQLQSQRLSGFPLYVSAAPERAAKQIAAREALRASLAEMLRVATDEEVVEVLVEALRAAPQIPAPAIVAGRLVARGVRLEPHHVEQVYEEHGLVPGKKRRAPARSARGAEESDTEAKRAGPGADAGMGLGKGGGIRGTRPVSVVQRRDGG
jgi:hypothetical protein